MLKSASNAPSTRDSRVDPIGRPVSDDGGGEDVARPQPSDGPAWRRILLPEAVCSDLGRYADLASVAA